MKLPTGLFLQSIAEKKVYYFVSKQISSEEPHYFICIKKTDNDLLILTCCTSQKDTIERLILKQKLSPKTMVWISPGKGEENPFRKDTYVNCNDSFTYTMEEFKMMYDKDSVTYSGEISEDHYGQILTGIHLSDLIDDETKELIPFPQ